MTQCRSGHGRLVPAFALVVGASLWGCEPKKTDDLPGATNDVSIGETAIQPGINPNDWQSLPPVASVLDLTENNARATDRLRRAGVPGSLGGDLHLALYQAGFEWSHERGVWSPLMCLRVPEAGPAGVNARDYFIHVLGSMVDLSPALAWVPMADDTPATYPGTDEPVPLLVINVLGLDTSRGVAQAEVSVVGVDGREVGRTATARHDGTRWTLSFQPVIWTR